jgi:DNA-binding Lrp family transcriptional regulator
MNSSAVMDELDKRVVRALQLSPRAAFSEVGEVLGVSEQTVARRFRRLRRAGLVRVTTGIAPAALGLTSWIVRVRCRPEGTAAVAEALARRDDVSWVTIHSAGWEVVFNLRAHSDADAEELLVRLLPKTAPVLDVSTAAILHSFVGGDPADWQGWRDTLTRQQTERLRPPARTTPPPTPTTLRADDHALLNLLTRDGRASCATLARATGSTAGRVRRRIEQLTGSGAIYFDIDIATAATGQHTSATVWLTVTPRHLDAVGRAVAAHDDVPFAAALTGPSNLIATLTAPGLERAYGFVTDTLGSLEGITGYELAPLLRRVKQAGALVVEDRLGHPARLPQAAPVRRS